MKTVSSASKRCTDCSLWAHTRICSLGLCSCLNKCPKCLGIQGLCWFILRRRFWSLWQFVFSLPPLEIICKFCTDNPSICCTRQGTSDMFQHIITVVLAPSSPVRSCYVRLCGRGLYVFLRDLLLSPLSFTSRALEVFGSSQNAMFRRNATCAGLAEAFAAGAVGFVRCSCARVLGHRLDVRGAGTSCGTDGRTVGRMDAVQRLRQKLWT